MAATITSTGSAAPPAPATTRPGHDRDQAGRHRADEVPGAEHGQRDDEQPAQAEPVGHPAVDRDADGAGEQEPGHHPGRLRRRRTELVADARQDQRDHVGGDGDQQHRRDEHEQQAGRRHVTARRVRGCGHEHSSQLSS
nr:hypothetical protein [Jiangella alba]